MPAEPASPTPEITLIAAVARNGVIGRGNELVFHEAADQRHFRASTMGCPVLMGRKTWDSLPERFRPLPGRHNLVLSRQPGLQLPGADVVHSLPEALARVAGAARLFVIGGAQLYALALPLAHTLELTEVDADLAGDSFFPAWDRSQFEATGAHGAATTAQGLPYRFVSYRRVSATGPSAPTTGR